MNHRDERADWPTSTTAVVLWQRGQGGGSGLGPLEVVIWVRYSIAAVPRRSRCACFETFGQTN